MRRLAIPLPLLAFALSVACSSGSGGGERETDAKQDTARQEAPSAPEPPRFAPLDEDNVEEALTAYGERNPATEVVLHTRLGDIRLRLYEETPLHRANFLRLIDMGFYEPSEFYRCIEGFMIQGGGSDSRDRPDIGKYTLPYEPRPATFHKRGALSMARYYENNPDKRSSAYQYFIVQGTRPFTRAELAEVGKEEDKTFSAEQYAFYSKHAGAPHLDGEHTIFGEVVEGMETVDKIAAEKTGEKGWPLESVYIEAEIVEAETEGAER